MEHSSRSGHHPKFAQLPTGIVKQSEFFSMRLETLYANRCFSSKQLQNWMRYVSKQIAPRLWLVEK